MEKTVYFLSGVIFAFMLYGILYHGFAMLQAFILKQMDSEDKLSAINGARQWLEKKADQISKEK